MLYLRFNWNLPTVGKTTDSDKNQDKKRYQRILSWCKRFALPSFYDPIFSSEFETTIIGLI